MPAPAAAALPFIAAGTEVASLAVQGRNPKRQFKYNKKLAGYQNKLNRANQEWMLAQNKALLNEQRSYDSPKAQMDRYIAAGLNPHLIYGQMSNGSGPIQVGGMPGVNVGGVDASYPTGNPAESFIAAQQAIAQTGLTGARTEESNMRTELMDVQREIAKTNPMLNPQVAASVANAMETTARAKAIENNLTWFKTTDDRPYSYGYMKIRADVEALEQRLDLNNVDLKIRNKIFESKEYENAVKLIQKKWLEDGELTPEHIRQGFMMLLSKMIGR